MSDRTAKLQRRLVENWPTGQQLIRRLGARPAREVFDLVLGNGFVQPKIKDARESDQMVLKFVDEFLNLELKNIARTSGTLGSLTSRLAAGSLALVADRHKTNSGTTNDSDPMKAAKWVQGSSNTGNLSPERAKWLIGIHNVIAMGVAAQTPMNDLQGIAYINSLLLDQAGRKNPRPPVLLPEPSPLPSSPAGLHMLQIAIRNLSSRTPGEDGCSWKDLACYLLGAVIACHGFPDANGRTARVLYSICWIRSGAPFMGVSKKGVDQLTRLGQAS